MTISQALQVAVQRHQAGQLAEAEALYRQILAVQPNDADALHFLGVIAQQVGQHDLAVELIERSIFLKPNNPAAHSNLGEAYRALARPDDALLAYSRALKLKPDLPETCNNLGIALRERGRLDEAVAAHRRAVHLKPDYPEAHNHLGITLREQGRVDEAATAFQRALHLRPGYPEAQNNLGAALDRMGNLDEAIAAYRRALELKTDLPETCNNLGVALLERGQVDEAVAACRRALELKPDYADAHNNLGNALTARGQLDESVSAYLRALALKPNFPEVQINLSNALRESGQLDGAVAMCLRVLELDPDYPEAHNNLGLALRDRGQIDDAIAAFRHAIEIKPDYDCAHSNLIYTLHFQPGHDDWTISEEHQRWNRQFADPLKEFVLPHANDRNLERPLRVGYVSPDFRDHPVGRFALPLFERHDRERYEILCYSGVTRPDWMTERLRSLAAGWRSTVGLRDARVAEMIREDEVDILVDLTMHTANHRLPVFARQPAPVQVSWLAYPGGTGLDGIDYRLTDACLDPPGEKPAWSAGERVRLPDCWCCYPPEGEYPEINALPALSAECVTFGSLNSFAKAHEGALALWARVLEAVTGSRVLMLCPAGQARERVRAFFGARGIAAERVELVGFLPRWEYLSLYQRIDVGLDPFPCNGMTTTCDALWMGAPVVSLAGKTPAARAGLSLLTNLGLPELIAYSEAEYVNIAERLAGDLPRLADLRATLRPRMLASPLMDAPRFALNVEMAYRSMWQRWCASGG